ncbi:MAG: uracil-DNA glycosylase [Rickettsiales bacterium]|nr:uracil-DNA glycosylase [Rickettsiales bacterium]
MISSADISLLRLYVESGAVETCGDSPCDFFGADAAAKPSSAGVKSFVDGFRRESAVSIGEATRQAAALAAGCGTLSGLQAAVAGFPLCPLKKFSASTIVGVGVDSPKLLAVTGIPSAEEDRTGRALSGDAGALLVRILYAIGMSVDEDAFALPAMFYRPPGGREPTGEELSTVLPFLSRYVGILKPAAILAFGPLPIRALLGDDAPVTSLRGRWREYAGVPVMPTFALPFLLSNREAKKKTWEDVQAVKERIG